MTHVVAMIGVALAAASEPQTYSVDLKISGMT
jgi:hypothetical protein